MLKAIIISASIMALASCGGTKKSENSFVVWNGNHVDPDVAVTRDADRRPLTYRLLGAQAPDVGDHMLENRWVLIDFWGIWCPDCLADGPHVAELVSAIQAHPDIEFLSIHTPPSRSRAAQAFGRWGSVQRYMNERDYHWPVVIDDDASVREAYRIDWTPTYLLVGPDRTIEAFRTDLGDTPTSALIADIEAIMVKRQKRVR